MLPGIVEVLHTFGAKLNFNCHIHMLCTLGGIDINTLKWKSQDYISEASLKARFKARLLHYLRQEYVAGNIVIPDYVKQQWKEKFHSTVFYDVQDQLYQIEWYLLIRETLENTMSTVGYVVRYAKRPAISETRILYYNKAEDIVKFEFKDKNTNEHKIISISVMNFIGLLVRHIPEKGCHLITYSGMYANARKNKIFKLVAEQIIALFGMARLLFNDAKSRAKTWRERILQSTGRDPLICPDCGLEMQLVQLAYRTRDGTMKTITFY